MSQAVNTAELDEYLEQVVQALRRTVSYAIPHVKDAEIAEKAVRDCEEMISVVMEGKVSEWLQ
jgi:hypothetical protein